MFRLPPGELQGEPELLGDLWKAGDQGNKKGGGKMLLEREWGRDGAASPPIKSTSGYVVHRE